MLQLFLAIFFFVTLCFMYYFYHRKVYSYWSSRGIPGPQPLPLIGNVFPLLKNTFTELEIKRATIYGSCYGKYYGTQPWLTITDHSLIRQVLGTDFPHFMNRMNLQTLSEYWNSNLLVADGHDWKRIRSLTSPAFTGSKLRGMHPLMGRSVDKLVSHLNSTLSSTDNQQIHSSTVQIKSVISCFAIDVIASTSFAIETNAFDCVDDKNENKNGNAVVRACRQLFVLPLLRIGAIVVLPKFLLRLFNIDCFLPPKPFQYLINLTRHIIQERKTTSGITAKKRTDFLQLLIDSKVDERELQADKTSYDHLEADSSEDEKSCKPEVDIENNFTKSLSGLTETEIIAQGIFFLTAGYETSSSTISHALFELAQNPSVQDEIYSELESALASLDASASQRSRSSPEYYKTVISELPFLEATLKETLRMYSPVQVLLRTLVTDGHKLENGICLEKGQTIEIPVGVVHKSSEYYPEPEVFRPERFLAENKHLLVPYTYLPFGAGARNCIGIRFAMQEMKICLAALLENFEFFPVFETLQPLKRSSSIARRMSFQKGTPVLNAKEFLLRISKRNVERYNVI